MELPKLNLLKIFILRLILTLRQRLNNMLMGLIRVNHNKSLRKVHLRKEKFHKLRKSKLLLRGDSPFKVIKKINDNACILDIPQSYEGNHIFHEIKEEEPDENLTSPKEDLQKDKEMKDTQALKGTKEITRKNALKDKNVHEHRSFKPKPSLILCMGLHLDSLEVKLGSENHLSGDREWMHLDQSKASRPAEAETETESESSRPIQLRPNVYRPTEVETEGISTLKTSRPDEVVPTKTSSSPSRLRLQ
ncbi:hypothetical protein CR513_38007, partial [Mucuna pruriens]